MGSARDLRNPTSTLPRSPNNVPKGKPMKAKPRKTKANRKPVEPKSKDTARNEPPESSRYKPGKSGNPGGRPKGSKNLSTILMEAARAPVIATINGKPRKISKIQATVMQLATKAAAGDRRSEEH